MRLPPRLLPGWARVSGVGTDPHTLGVYAHVPACAHTCAQKMSPSGTCTCAYTSSHPLWYILLVVLLHACTSSDRCTLFCNTLECMHGSHPCPHAWAPRAFIYPNVHVHKHTSAFRHAHWLAHVHASRYTQVCSYSPECMQVHTSAQVNQGCTHSPLGRCMQSHTGTFA